MAAGTPLALVGTCSVDLPKALTHAEQVITTDVTTIRTNAASPVAADLLIPVCTRRASPRTTRLGRRIAVLNV
jgi:hypothetical protein